MFIYFEVIQTMDALPYGDNLPFSLLSVKLKGLFTEKIRPVEIFSLPNESCFPRAHEMRPSLDGLALCPINFEYKNLQFV